MSMVSKEERQERRRAQREGVEALEASGALDELYSMIDAGQVQLEGRDGLIQQLIKAGLERGMQAELSDHLGYEKGDPDAALFPNSRNGSFPKTVGTIAGDVELAVPRDRDGTFTPMLVPKGARRLSGLDDMIISLYAGGMTVRDIEHHLVSTVGTEVSRETISKVTDEVLDEVLAWQRRPLESFYPVIYLDAIVVKVRDGAHVRNKAAHIAVGVDMDDARARDLGPGRRGREVLGRGLRRAGQPRRPGRAHRLLRRAHRLPRGDRGDLARVAGADLICPQWRWPNRSASHLRRGGQNPCRRVALEAHMQTRSAAAGQNRESASGRCDAGAAIAEMRS
ncbi:hypothetical protein SCMU_38330 [Sinomonas cyclohexanicum]|uniref:Mutator family transposase n=1 Tax=Sinomonas cyclohexanicum TaxID=322009 RepID=A0ABM7Q098_SINCY|nr:hypothetical protein SCMU_38330 [Corynebacterium cyclohexanicum]